MTATLTEQLRLPAGHNPPSAFVTLQLAGVAGAAVEGFVNGQSIVSSYTITVGVGAAGAWSASSIERNDLITPAGTRWLRTVKINQVVVASDYLNVTADGTFRVDQVLSDAPGAIVDPDDAALLGNRIALLEAIEYMQLDGGDAASTYAGSIDGGSA